MVAVQKADKKKPVGIGRVSRGEGRRGEKLRTVTSCALVLLSTHYITIQPNTRDLEILSSGLAHFFLYKSEGSKERTERSKSIIMYYRYLEIQVRNGHGICG